VHSLPPIFQFSNPPYPSRRAQHTNQSLDSKQVRDSTAHAHKKTPWKNKGNHSAASTELPTKPSHEARSALSAHARNLSVFRFPL
jgi:hypothetical protein